MQNDDYFRRYGTKTIKKKLADVRGKTWDTEEWLKIERKKKKETPLVCGTQCAVDGINKTVIYQQPCKRELGTITSVTFERYKC